MANWIAAAEGALDGRAVPNDFDVDVIERFAPPLLDLEGRRAIMSPFFASFMWAAVVFRDTQSGEPLDPITLLLRLLALALSVRAVIGMLLLAKRLRLWLAKSRCGLALTSEGLLYRGTAGDVVVPVEDILDVRERGDWRGRSGRRFSEVYVVTQPGSGRTHVALPPIFERTPGVLAERLMRWLGPRKAHTPLSDIRYPEPEQLASKLWERVAAGERPLGVTVLMHGRSWLRRGPYASMLLGLAVLDGFVRLPPAARKAVGMAAPLVLVLSLVVVPLAWILMTRFEMKSRRGLSLLLTPAEMLMRTRAGIHRVRWSSVAKLEVVARTAWSLLLGAHENRNLVIERKDAEPIVYTEAFLGAPAEVVIALCDGYRKGLIGDAGVGASPASGNGDPSGSSTPAS